MSGRRKDNDDSKGKGKVDDDRKGKGKVDNLEEKVKEKEKEKKIYDRGEVDAHCLGTFPFDCTNSNDVYYVDFINSFVNCDRDLSTKRLVSPIDENLNRQNRPLLETIKTAKLFKYFDIEFSVADEVSAFCRFRACDLYLIAFKSGTKDSQWFCFRDWNMRYKVNKIDYMEELKETADYACLGGGDPFVRGDIELGYYALPNHVYGLTKPNPKAAYPSILFFTQFICEPIRFPDFVKTIGEHYKDGIKLGAKCAREQNHWACYGKEFSKAILQETRTGLAMSDETFHKTAMIMMDDDDDDPVDYIEAEPIEATSSYKKKKKDEKDQSNVPKKKMTISNTDCMKNHFRL